MAVEIILLIIIGKYRNKKEADMHLKNSILIGLFLALIPSVVSLHTLDARGATLCAHQRGDNRCNDHEDCCEGRKCNSFGYCELRR